MIHSEIMLLEIIRLYVENSKESSIEVEKLKNAFYTLEEIIGNRLAIAVQYEFDNELENLLNICDGLMEIDEEFIVFFEDDFLDLVEDQVLLKLEGEDLSLDGFLADFTHNICLYKDLDIKPPIEEYKNILDLCFSIMQDYQLLALQEAKSGKFNLALFSLLKVFVDKYKEMYAAYTFEDIDKIKVVLSYLSDYYLLDGDSDFINSNWYMVLFSKNEKQKNYLIFDRLFHSISDEDEEYENEEDEDLLDGEISFDDLLCEITYLDNEVDFFIAYYTVLLNQYLKEIENGKVKNILTLKKYSLIAIEPDIEDYFFSNGTIDTLPLPELKPEWIHNHLFNPLYLTTIECVNCFNCKDKDLTHDIYAEMIIGALFIKSFLNLCKNADNLENVKSKILNSEFYKNKDYSVATNLVDNVIFKDLDIELIRKRK